MLYPDLLKKNILNALDSDKIAIAYGSGQIGKTTLVQKIQAEYGGKSQFYQGDDPEVKSFFENQNQSSIVEQVRAYELIIIDEAQRIENIDPLLLIH